MVAREDQGEGFTRRALFLGGAGGLAFAGISGRLYKIQILDSSKYQGLSEENQFNYQLLVPSRGRILDQNGSVLCENAENYRLLLMPEQIGDVGQVLAKLTDLLDLSEHQLKEIRKNLKNRRQFSSVLIAENLAWETFAKTNLKSPDLPGVRPDVSETRKYLFPEAFSHILGYVGSVPAEQARNAPPLFRHPGFRIGRTGVEKNYDSQLLGEPGALKIEVNAVGRVVRELPDAQTAARAGNDIQLTLDRDLQVFTASTLAGESASACVLDAKTGALRAMVSTPGFDPNKFARGISSRDYDALLQDKFKPLFNKSIGGAYPPASCFKPVIAMAAFDAGLINPAERIRCTGKITFGDRDFHCWHRKGHGRVDLNAAIGTSCDIYFYELARRLGIERIHDAAIEFGFGKLMDFSLGGGTHGLVPNEAWKRARFDLPWAQGETLIAGIGQGYLSATPLQLAVMTARIATGTNVVPSLLAGEQIIPTRLPFSEAALQIARKGMWSVVNVPWGTAFFEQGVDDLGTEWAGKTGTGQVRRITAVERENRVLRNEELPWKLRDHALFVGFAPFDDPKFAISVVVEHGGGGSKVAAPKARAILKHAMLNASMAELAKGPAS